MPSVAFVSRQRGHLDHEGFQSCSLLGCELHELDAHPAAGLLRLRGPCHPPGEIERLAVTGLESKANRRAGLEWLAGRDEDPHLADVVWMGKEKCLGARIADRDRAGFVAAVGAPLPDARTLDSVLAAHGHATEQAATGKPPAAAATSRTEVA